ncbi:hypothetical protein IFT87_03230 [Sphingomonas sp. CFBP 8765]|nr:hypothetical protein [Sphingomonas sp. CFBP 8765]
MSLARKHRDRILASQMASAPALGSGLSSPASDAGTPAERAAASIAMRLQHDLRRLKEIQSIARRIDVKREMLPAYTDWVAGLLDGGRNAGAGIAEDVLPTVMVWLIDTGDYARALLLAEHVIAYDVPLPSRYERSAAALIVEEIADAAIRAQTAKAPFPLDVLEHVAELTADADMHDQVRAKLHKAIGTELARAADAIDPAKPEFAALAQRALDPLRRAVALHDRVGVAGQIKRLERALAPPKPTTKSAGTVPAT